MDELAGWVLGLLAALIVIGFAIDGIVWVVINLWWVLLPVALALLVWLLCNHPGVRAKRQVKAVVKRGNQQRASIRTATERTTAEMHRIARDWKQP